MCISRKSEVICISVFTGYFVVNGAYDVIFVLDKSVPQGVFGAFKIISSICFNLIIFVFCPRVIGILE